MTLARLTRLAVLGLAVAAASAGSARADTLTILTSMISTSPTAPPDLTFTPMNLNDAPLPTPNGGITFNFLQIAYAGGTSTVGPASYMVSGLFTIYENGTQVGTSKFSETFTYQLTNGNGSYRVTDSYIQPPNVDGVNFNPIMTSAPTLLANKPSTGSLSTLVTATAVPEPS